MTMLTIADVIQGLSGGTPALGGGTPSLGGGASPAGDASVQSISRVVIDSRVVEPGDLFVALTGEHTDGHNFAADAFGRGAVAALVEQDLPLDCYAIDLRSPSAAVAHPLQGIALETLPVCLRVNSTLRAMQDLAGYWRAKFDVRTIGITGSVGKTSTKELVWAVLARQFRTVRNEGNLNNEIGVPLTLLQLKPEDERLVLEMGTYARGEIARLCELARPVVGVVTNVGPVHMERLGSLEAIADAKAELVEALPPQGVAVLNYDEPLVLAMARRTKARVLFYGLDSRAELWADDIESEGLEGIRFRMHYGREHLRVHVPLLGRHSVHTALRAAAVGLAEGMAWDDILAGLQDREAQIRLVAVPGPQGSMILDDTYNSSPASAIAALNLLDELDGRKIAVLGDMLELGSYEQEGHQLVGRRAMDVAEILVAVGSRGRIIGQEALRLGMSPSRVYLCDDNRAAIEYLQANIQSGDYVLVKGSRGMKMEDIVAALGKG
jgi:UDP-N-acetylmuramoyl-tripeptide--D-alanyl-D-alanine ligase